MSNINCTCPHCQMEMSFPSAAVDQQGKCSGCQQVITIQPDPAPPLPDPAAKKKIIIIATAGCGGLVVLGLALCVVLFLFLFPREQQTAQTTDQPVESRNEPANEPANEPPNEGPSVFRNTIGMKFNKIPAGTFTMGSPASEKGRYNRYNVEQQHKVTISKAFYMQTTEVTQGQWKEVMGTEPWKGKQYVKEGPNYAATYVSWDAAVAFCKKLSEKEGKTYRLPTEAEWEYACRAGTKTAWSFGDDEKVLGDYAWYATNTWDIGEKFPHQVGLKKPNAFGLYDMHGNVFEWCHDYCEYGENYYNKSPEKDPTGPVSGSTRALRGGSWNLQGTRSTRSACRDSSPANLGFSFNHGYGFRIVRELD